MRLGTDLLAKYYKILISSRAATISWWDRRFRLSPQAAVGVWLRLCCLVGRAILPAAAFLGGVSRGAHKQEPPRKAAAATIGCPTFYQSMAIIILGII
jgi:hypothetical protein